MRANRDTARTIRSHRASGLRGRLALLTVAGGLALSAWGAGARAADKPYHRIEVRPQAGAPLPYTIEVPEGWELVQAKELPGLFMGPPGAIPPNDPSLLYVRGSQVSLADPAAVAQAIRENDVQQPWSAPRLEIKDLGGVKGLLVRMDSGEGDKARSTLVLKLPLGEKAVDFLFQAPRATFEKNLPQYERMLLSVRPVPGTPEAKPKKWGPAMPLLPFRGRWPRAGEGVFLAPGAYVTGDVTLGDQVSFWFHTAARGDVNSIRIGARTNVQDGTILHVTHERFPLVIGAEVVVGHSAMLHGCTIEDGALIGIGARVLDGAVVERGAQVGAGALVAPGYRIPAGMLALGVPARVVRPLSAEEVRQIGEIAARYAALKEEYRATLGSGLGDAYEQQAFASRQGE